MGAAITVAAGLSGSAWAQVDNQRIVVDTPNATGGNSFATYGYDPSTDSAYVTGFGAGAALRKVTNVGGAQTSTVQVSESQLQLYLRDGDPNRSVLNSLQSGLVLNPLPVGALPAYSFAIINDAGATRLPASNTTDPTVTKRLYRYNLQAVGPAGTPAPPYGDGRDVYTTLLTLSGMAAIHGNPTSTSSNFGRQGAFSTDGQAFYSIDSSAAYGGIYKTTALDTTGSTSLILTDSDINTEPAVLPAAGGGDRIFFRGTANSGNAGGLNFVTSNGATTSAPQVAISAATLGGFLERTVGTADIRALSSDSAGNLYLFDTTSTALLRLDPQGRLSKLTTRTERTAFRDQSGRGTTTVNANILRQQTRTITHPTAGIITEVLFGDSTQQNTVSGIYAFKAGDFNRDGTLTSTDIDLFKPVLTTRGVVQTNSANYKFDANGNTFVDWKDVKIFQGFFDFGDGDVNLNGRVDFADFQVLQNNFGLSAKTFIQGDLDGDNDVDFGDFQILQNSFGYTSTVLTPGAAAPFDAAVFEAFAASAVPEPGTLGLGIAGVMMALGHRRRRRALGKSGASN